MLIVDVISTSRVRPSSFSRVLVRYSDVVVCNDSGGIPNVVMTDFGSKVLIELREGLVRLAG